jgi:Family of unknown function (DUF5995)
MSPPDVTAVETVIKELQAVVDRALDEGSRIGYFASLYTRMTGAVRGAVLAGEFNDPEGVVRLDVAFARRYLTAVDQLRSGDPRISPPWAEVFRLVARRNLTIVQQLTLSMNAHINFDLGLATYETFAAPDLARAHADFVKVNDVLATVVAEVENEIGQLSPVLRIAERIGGSFVARIIDFGLVEARKFAWEFAQLLALADAAGQPALIDQKAQEVALICRALRQKPMRNLVLAIVAAFEVKDARRVIRTLDRGLATG